MKPSQYVDRLRLKTRTGSDYAVAKLLKVNEATVHRYRDDAGAMDPWACLQTARLLDLPLEQVIADMEAFREKNPERRAVWSDLAGKFAASVIAVSVTTIGVSGDTTPDGQGQTKEPVAVRTVDIMSNDLGSRWPGGFSTFLQILEVLRVCLLRQISPRNFQPV